MPAENSSSQIFIISGPSGVGKDTIAQAILKEFPYLVKPISYTTRPQRPEDRPDGEEYYFVSDGEFKALMQEGEILEWASVHGHLYGTSKSEIEKQLNTNKNVLLVIDVNGGIALKKVYPFATLIFIKYQSVELLKTRLTEKRPGIDAHEVEIRYNTALNEMVYEKSYDYSIVNPEGQPESAIQAVGQIIIDKVKATPA